MLSTLGRMLSRLFRLDRQAPSSSEIRQESYWLGSRHQGDILAGAKRELVGLNPNSRRAALLNAIVLKERAA
jgi:hypothetical protein